MVSGSRLAPGRRSPITNPVNPACSENSLRNHLPAFAKFASLFAAALGSIVLLGWIFNIHLLVRWFSNLVPTSPSTALAFIFSGFSLWRLRQINTIPNPDRVGRLLAAGVILLGLLQLAEFLFEIRLLFDQLLFAKQFAALRSQPVEQMAPNVGL